jgi:hypothetical protein
MTDPKDRIEHTIEVLVLAPIGVGLYLRDMGPTFVNMFVARGRAEIDRRQAQVQQRTTTAKSIGQVAMTFGVPMVRQRVERDLGSARQRAQTFLGSIGGIDPSATRPAPTKTNDTSSAPAKAPTRPAAQTSASETNGTDTNRSNGASGTGDSLPIPGYDALSASQVVERLAGLSADELDAVRTYEGSHRNRRTILGKIDQISA